MFSEELVLGVKRCNDMIKPAEIQKWLITNTSRETYLFLSFPDHQMKVFPQVQSLHRLCR